MKTPNKYKKVKMNRKAQLFALGLVIITIILMGFALNSFVLVKKKIEMSVFPPSELIEVYDAQQKLLFYAQESAVISSHEALHILTNKILGGNCRVLASGHVLWNDSCMPEDVEIKFLEEFKKNFAMHLTNYPYEKTPYNITLEDGKLNFRSGNLTLNVIKNEGYTGYNANFTFKQDFTFNLSEESIELADFNAIYTTALKCIDKNATKVMDCMNQLERWSTKAILYEDNLLFDLATKQSFFTGDDFSDVELRFAMLC